MQEVVDQVVGSEALAAVVVDGRNRTFRRATHALPGLEAHRVLVGALHPWLALDQAWVLGRDTAYSPCGSRSSLLSSCSNSFWRPRRARGSLPARRRRTEATFCLLVDTSVGSTETMVAFSLRGGFRSTQQPRKSFRSRLR